MPLTNKIERLQQLSMKMLASLQNQKLEDKKASGQLDELIEKTLNLIDELNKLSSEVSANGYGVLRQSVTAQYIAENYTNTFESIMAAKTQLSYAHKKRSNVAPNETPLTKLSEAQNASTIPIPLEDANYPNFNV